MKIATVLGTRPQIIKLARMIAALDRYSEHVLVHTGQNYDYELNQIFFEDLEIRKPDFFLDASGQTAAETIGLVIARSDAVLREIQPDAVLILGDTNSCLAAMVAKRQKIPVFHMEAGNRCFDQRVPEEINRRIIDHISDINLPYSAIAREYLLREGLPPDRVIVTGSPMYEVLHHYLAKIEASDVLTRLGLAERAYFVVSAHREENVDDSAQFAGLIDVLRNLAETGRRCDHDHTSAHPQTHRGRRGGVAAANRAIEAAWVQRLRQASDERPRSTLRQWHHHRGVFDPQLPCAQHPRGPRTSRGDGRRRGHDGGAAPAVGEVGRRAGRPAAGDDRLLCMVQDYAVPKVSEKVVRIILSYTDYVNRVVWYK